MNFFKVIWNILYIRFMRKNCHLVFDETSNVKLIARFHNVPKFSYKQAWANSADPEQLSDQGLHCLQFPLRLLDSLLRKSHLIQLLG